MNLLFIEKINLIYENWRCYIWKINYLSVQTNNSFNMVKIYFIIHVGIMLKKHGTQKKPIH